MSSANGHHFSGLRIIGFESRHADELKQLIEQFHGVPTIVPALREIPLGTSAELLEFERVLLTGELDLVIFLTGNGANLLAREIDKSVPRNQWFAALKKTSVIARGPQAVAALQSLEVPVTLPVMAPHTWREVLLTLDMNKSRFPLQKQLVAVQEYGMMNRKLLKGLQTRGAEVMRVPVYKWALPENLRPLRLAIANIMAGNYDVALFTSGTQVWHLFKIAAKKGLEDELRQGLSAMVVGSIGPSTSEALTDFAVPVDFTPPQAKMGSLVKYAALQSPSLLSGKRSFAARLILPHKSFGL